MLLAVCAAMSFAVLDTTSKYLSQTYPVPMVSWARYAFHVLLMAVFLLPSRGRMILRTRRPRLQVIRGVCLGLSSLIFFGALSLMPVAEASAIISIGPILVSVVAVYWLREQAPRGTWIALAVSFAGVLLIVRPGSALFTPAALLPVLAAVFSTGFTLATRKLAGIDEAVNTLFLGAIAALVLLSGLLPFYWKTPQTLWHMLLFVATGALGAGGHYLLVLAYERANATTIAPFMYANIIAALAMGWLIFDTFPDAVALIGIGLIVSAGVGLAMLRRT
jgi:drug/metabolite transporter (DMT)-like permease